MFKWNIGWGCTSKCNMKCQFCYSHEKRQESSDLCYEDWIKFIDNNHDCIATINYGTGENTLSNDWFKLISYIRHKYPSIKQALTTNGHLFEACKNPENLNSFIESIDEVDISLDYFEEKKHIEFRGQVNAYNWALGTLDLCKKYNKRITIVFIGTKSNLYKENIDGIFQIAEQFHALIRMNLYRPTIGFNSVSERFLPDTRKIVDILLYIESKYKIVSLNDSLFSSVMTDLPKRDPSGVDSLRILPDGKITPSTYLIKDNFVVGNILEENVLLKIFNEKRCNSIIKDFIPEKCNLCKYVNNCRGGVYDRRYLWFSSLVEKDPYCNDEFLKEFENRKIKVVKTKFESVHDGYLPTMFFKA